MGEKELEMSEFTPITTQEEFDDRISERLKRERETIAKKYADYETISKKNEDLTKQNADYSKSLEAASKKIKDHDDEVKGLQSKIAKYETDSVKTRIANEQGLPYELAKRLSGDDEEAIRKDAEGLAKLVKDNKPVAPLANPEGDPGKKDDKVAAVKNMLHTMKGE